MGSKKVIAAGLAVAALVVIVWLSARSRSTDEPKSVEPILPVPKQDPKTGRELSQEEILKIVEKQEKLLQAKDEDWKRLKISVGETLSEGGGFPLKYGFAIGIRPLLELGESTSIANTKISVQSSVTGLETIIWSYTAPYRLKVDWNTQKLERIKAEGPAKLAFNGLELGETSKEFKFNNPISVMFTENLKDKTKGITISRLDDKDNLKWNLVAHLPYNYKNWQLLPCYAMPEYPIVIAPKTRVAGAQPISIMIFDAGKGALIGEVPMPAELKNERPCFALDTVQHILIGAGYYLDWHFYVDLRPYMKTAMSIPK